MIGAAKIEPCRSFKYKYSPNRNRPTPHPRNAQNQTTTTQNESKRNFTKVFIPQFHLPILSRMGVGSPTALSPVSSILLNKQKRHVMFKKKPRQPSRISEQSNNEQKEEKETTKQKE